LVWLTGHNLDPEKQFHHRVTERKQVRAVVTQVIVIGSMATRFCISLYFSVFLCLCGEELSLILYLHGFRSSPHSTKAQQLREYMESKGLGDQFCCPQLPISPLAAIALAGDIIKSADRPLTIAGSSLGGYYATWLMERHWQWIHHVTLVNPAVNANAAEAFIGTQTNWHTGESFEFTRQHVSELQALEVSAVKHQERYWLLLETGDEVLDYHLAVAKYSAARHTVLEGGDHSFTRWGDYLDEIVTLDKLVKARS
jgi:uncharacterized protein